MSEVRIACPKCDWEPLPDDVWSCGCGHQWHTFDTHGRCPACGKQWRDTQCFTPTDGGCSRWSPHIDWYRGLDEWVRREIEEALKLAEVPVV